MAITLQGCVGAGSQARIEASQKQLNKAQQLQRQGQLDEALEAFSLALEENPKLVEAYMGIGEIYRERGDFESASQSYRQATEISPNSFDAHFYHGLTLQLLGKIRDSVITYLRALAIEPESYEANLNVASAYLQLGRAADALPYAQRATELKPDQQAAWANLAAVFSLVGQYEQAVDAYRQAVELGELAEQILLGLANAHIHLKHYTRAINVLKSLNRQFPSATSYERQGYAQFKMRLFDEALASFRAALSIDRQDTASLNGLGVCLMTMFLQSGRTVPAQRDEALSAWRRSVQLRPEQPRIIDLLTRYQRL